MPSAREVALKIKVLMRAEVCMQFQDEKMKRV
jgi:hypothetical protein